MNNQKIETHPSQCCTVTSPGKLFISGEWGVLSGNCPALLLPTKRRVQVRVQKRKDDTIILQNLNSGQIVSTLLNQGKLTVENSSQGTMLHREFRDAIHAVEKAFAYLGTQSGLFIEIETIELYFRKERKIGLGSSAAVVAAIISAIFKIYGYNIDDTRVKVIIFKLAVVTHSSQEGRWCGSGADVACSVFGSYMFYRNALKDDSLLLKGSLRQTFERDSNEFVIRKLVWPAHTHLLVGWTGQPSSSRELVEAFGEWRKEHPVHFERFSRHLAALVIALCLGIEAEDFTEIKKCVSENQRLLADLSSQTQLPIVTPELKRMVEIVDQAGGAGKLSGAGGGDCGIAFVLDPVMAERVKTTWSENGVKVINI